MSEEKEWMPVRGADGYLINESGEVKGKRGRVLKHLNGNMGYKFVVFTLPGETGLVRKTAYIHRLLAEAFLPAPDDEKSYVVRHKNGVYTDNRLENLFWLDRAEQIREMCEKGRELQMKRAEERKK